MSVREAVAATAAVLIVDHGLDFESAKRKAAAQHGLDRRERDAWPDNLEVEDAVREHLSLFYADTAADTLTQLRQLACQWMQRLAEFQPHLTGAVWRGVASEHSPVLIDLYCDDPTAPEIHLMNLGVPTEGGEREGARGESVPMLRLDVSCRGLGQVPVVMTVWPVDALRGALLPDRRGQPWRGALRAVQQLLETETPDGK